MSMRKFVRALASGSAFLLASAAMLVVSPVMSAAAADIPAPYPSLAAAVKAGFVQQESVDRAAKRGAAHVIVQLRLPTPFQPEGSPSGLKIADSQRLAIKAVQDKVLLKLNDVKTNKIDKVKQYQTIPHMALAVDTAALTTLVTMTDLVVQIEVDHNNAADLANSVPLIGADKVRRAENGSAGAGQTVAILDTGVDAAHPFLNPRVIGEACFSSGSPWFATDHDDHGLCPGGNDSSSASGSGAPCNVQDCNHGTNVAGIAAGHGTTFNGVAPESNILAIQVFHSHDDNGDCMASGGRSAPCILAYDSDVLQGLERVFALRATLSPALAAVNLSLGSGYFTSRSGCDSNNSGYKDAIDNLRSFGIATVAAAGNFAQVINPTTRVTTFMNGVGVPACISSAVSVGATTGAAGAAEQVAGFSQTASFLDLLAPGVAINSSVPGGGFLPMTGTSQATPHVTGAWAVLKALSPGANVSTILNTLTASGTIIGDTRSGTNLPKPRIQLDAAAEAFLGTPLPPSNLRWTGVSGTTIGLAWDDNSPSETSFVVGYKRSVDATFTLIAGLRADSTATTVTGLVPNTSYQLVVQACGPICSPISNQLTVATLDTLPSTPTNFRAGSVTNASIQLLWDNNSVHPVTYFQISGTIINASNPGFASHSFTFSGLGPNTDYIYQIRACNTDGCSPYSGAILVTTLTSVPLPVAPSNLHVCGIPFVWPPVELCMAGGIPVVWNDNSNNETSFEMQGAQALNGVPPWMATWNSVVLPPNTVSFRLASATPGTLYYLQVRACNSGGCSGWSNLLTYTP